MLTWLKDNLMAFAQWLLDLVLYFPRLLVADLTESGIKLINFIPCANACYQTVGAAKAVLAGQNIPDVYGSGSTVLSMLNLALYYTALAQGLEMIGCVLLLRFLIRRLPVIG